MQVLTYIVLSKHSRNFSKSSGISMQFTSLNFNYLAGVTCQSSGTCFRNLWFKVLIIPHTGSTFLSVPLSWHGLATFLDESIFTWYQFQYRIVNNKSSRNKPLFIWQIFFLNSTQQTTSLQLYFTKSQEGIQNWTPDHIFLQLMPFTALKCLGQVLWV